MHYDFTHHKCGYGCQMTADLWKSMVFLSRSCCAEPLLRYPWRLSQETSQYTESFNYNALINTVDTTALQLS